jgi:carboxyl-terminal processing protease
MTVMTTNRSLSWSLHLAVISFLWLCHVAHGSAIQAPAVESSSDKAKALVKDVIGILDSDLAAPVEPTWTQRRAAALAANPRTLEESQTLLIALLQSVRDPNTRLLTADQFEALQNEFSRKSPTTGITDLNVHRGSPEGELVVVAPIAGSSAAAAGIDPGDVIVSVNGSPTAQLTRSEVMQRLRGEAGTVVAIGIRRGRHEFTLQLKRELNPSAPVSSSAMTEGGGKYGYISVNEFSAVTADQVAEAVKHLSEQGSSGFVLDLRRNPGGLLDAAAQVTGAFSDQKSLCAILRRTGVVDPKELKGTKLTMAPLIVIVDEGTASAAEVVAAALQESRRAMVVGERTFGQGYVYAVHPFGDGSALILASGTLQTPGGRALNGTGLSPDIVVHLPHDAGPRGSSHDPQLAMALSCLAKPCKSER